MTSPRPRSTTPTQHPRKCAVDGCERAVKARGFCRRCYWQHWKRGQIQVERPTVKWAASLADDLDWAVVDRLVSGECVPYTSHERREAVRRLIAAGVPKREAARLLRIDDRQVYRDLGISA